MTPLLQRWHHIVSIAGLLISGVVIGAAGERTIDHLRHGGFRFGPLPPPVTLSGSALPRTVSLSRDLTRIHNQGNSNSCVGQTLSTIVEILDHQRHPHTWRHYSAGYIWNQVDRGRNQGITYQDAFAVLLKAGDARLHDFPYDGASGWGILPTSYTRTLAYPHRVLSWRSINPSDQVTMETELSEGRPLGIAIPVTDAYYSPWQSRSLPVIDSQYGRYYFNHSITGIGYTPRGIITLNSWGPQYGYHGRALLTWHFLATAGAEIVVAQPLPRPPRPPRRPIPSGRTDPPSHTLPRHRDTLAFSPSPREGEGAGGEG